MLPLQKPKQDRHVLGLSDITALHVYFAQRWGWQTLHAPVLSRFGAGRATDLETQEVFEILNGERASVTFDNLLPINSVAKKLKTHLKGKVIGGNLCTLEALVGTPYQAKTRGKILFLEEVHERGYRILRSLVHLQQAGSFDGVKAVVWGDITGGDELDGSNRTWEAVNRFFEKMKVPAFRGIQSGHGDVQRPLPMNTPATLSPSKSRKQKCFHLQVKAPRFKQRGSK